MAVKRGHICGGKAGGKHTTINPAAEKVVRAIVKMPEINKIVPGIIANAKCTPGIVVTTLNPTCLMAKFRGNTSVQEIRVYLDNSENLKKVEQAIYDAARKSSALAPRPAVCSFGRGQPRV